MTGRLLLVGRDWGYHEQMAQRPFVGPAGSLLNRALKTAGIEREACLISNVVSAKPPHDEWRLHAPGAVAAGVAALQALCRRETPSLIVALGSEALHTFVVGDPDAKLYKITEARGYVFPSPFGPVLAATHPAFILRNWHPWWALLCYDLKKARRLYDEGPDGGRGGASTARREELWTEPPTAPAARSIHSPIAVDIETNSDLSVACLGWAVEPDVGHCAPFTPEFEPWFRRLLASPNPKVFQNGQFDTTILERAGFEVVNWQHDTMLLWATLEPLLAGKIDDSGGKPTHKGLRFLASLWTDQPWFKDYNFVDDEARYTLCATDARITLEVFLKMEARLHVL